MKRLFAAMIVLVPGLAFADLTGNPLVMNGDTLQFGEQEVSLYGVHAPMITQTCGEADVVWSCGWDAAMYLEEVIGDSEVVCTDVREVHEDHVMARCSTNGEDLAGIMIDAGLAVADEEMGQDYAPRAMTASNEGVGMWSGPFVDPVTYAESGGCFCSARKKSMMDTANLLKSLKEDSEEGHDQTTD